MTDTLAAACTFCDVTPSSVAELSSEPSRALSTAGYDAVKEKGRRQAPSHATKHEDRTLYGTDRRKAIGGVRDLRRNSSLIDWMIRRHMDYVATFRFQSKTGEKAYDNEVEDWIRQQSRPKNCDVRGLFSLQRFVRMSETMSVLDGDLGINFVDPGGPTGLVQGIEGDRIRDPDPGIARRVDDPDNWYNGVRVDPTWGRPIEYAVHKRSSGSSLTWERNIPAGNFHLHAYRGRFDQYRGISPLLSAYNQARDVYEAEEYAMVRSKAASMLMAGVKRSLDSPLGEKMYEVDEDGEPIPSTYQVDMGRGPIWLDMDPGDEIQLLDSDNPGANLQDFWKFVTLLALKALDMPYGLFDESSSNFFGNKTAWLGYDRACEDKRENLRELLDRITLFKYRIAIKRGDLSLPKRNGKQLTLADQPWQWVPRKMPWWRPLEEVTAYLKAIEGGLTTPQRVCAESDQGDWYENVDQIAEAIKYAEAAGVPLSFVISQDMANNVAVNRKD